MNILRIPMFVLATTVPAHGFATTVQQEKMAVCNAKTATKVLKGDERKALMSGRPKTGALAGGKATAQQEKMKNCNADASAKSLRGDERKAFMNSCLKTGGSARAAIQQEKMKTCNVDATVKTLRGDKRGVSMSICLRKWTPSPLGSVWQRIVPVVLSALRTGVV